MAEIVRSVFGVPIRLTDERWEHIITGHPVLADVRALVLETIASPTIVRKGKGDTLLAAKLLDGKWLVVVYRELSSSDGFVITAYPTRNLREEGVVWRS